jgi:N-acetylglutamate synthase-like GNAT family acetyltransferase
LLADDNKFVGFVIYQIDKSDNEWNFKEGWGDVREIYVTAPSREKGYGKFMLSASENKMNNLGAKNIYTIPDDEAIPFFLACGYEESDEHNDDLDAPVFIKCKA